MFCTQCGCPCRAGQCPVCGGTAQPMPLRLPAPRKKRNKLPILILSLLTLVGLALFFLLPSASPEETPNTAPDSVVREDCFTLQHGILTFDPSRYDGGPVLVIPSSIDGQHVTSIGAGCFEDVTGITTIILPGTIETIHARAFANCEDLRGLNVPPGCRTIMEKAFFGCGNLEALNIPNTVTYIGDDAFEDCHALLYIFYGGKFADWNTMYPDYINPFVWAICADGEYLQGTN